MFDVTVSVESLGGFDAADAVIGSDEATNISFVYSAAWESAFAYHEALAYDNGFYPQDGFVGGTHDSSVGTSLFLGTVTVDTAGMFREPGYVQVHFSLDGVSQLILGGEGEALEGFEDFVVGVTNCAGQGDDWPCPDDGNECTDDYCFSDVCIHPARGGGTPCGDPSDSECDNPDTCDGAGSCLDNHELVGTSCTDDGNDCTDDVCDGLGTCTHPDLSAGTSCDDGDICTGNDECDGLGSCGGIPIPGCLPSRRYVKWDAGGANDGTNWDNGFNDLQDALGAAAGLGGTVTEIWVAQGTYPPATCESPPCSFSSGSPERADSFQLLNGVSIYGGFARDESSLEERDIEGNETILSGDLNGDDAPVACVNDSPDCDSDGGLCAEDGLCIIEANDGENSYHVVTGSGTDGTAVLDGFTITAGNAEVGSGGGMYNDTGSPTVTNCRFTRNSSATHGGGMQNISGSLTVSDCEFTKNSTGFNGGGMNNWEGTATITNCVFSENFALAGGGMMNEVAADPIIRNCTFSNNTASDNGGAMTNSESSPTLIECTFGGNSASIGGAIQNNTNSNPSIINSNFSGNLAGYVAGAIQNSENCNPLITNCMFSGNSAADSAGAINNSSGSSPTLTTCTIAGNSATVSGGGLRNEFGMNNPVLTGCILWGNIDAGGTDESAQIHTDGGSPTVDYSTVQGGWTGAGGTGIVVVDPEFVRHPDDGGDGWGDDPATPGVDEGANDDYGDLRLQAGSPCIDAADSTAVPADSADLDGDGDTAEATPLDLDGNFRFVDDPDTPDTGVPGSAVVDMGGYEYIPDCNGNSMLDVCDVDCSALDGDCDLPGCGTAADCNSNDVPDECDIAGVGSVFDDPSAWATYDYGADPSGCALDPNCTNADGYAGAVFDGRHVYFVAHHNADNYHGEFLRYDTFGELSAPSSWTVYDPGANGVGTDPDGYAGGIFEGRYILFVPKHNGTENHGEVLRYDTLGDFDTPSSWAAYDPGANGIGDDPDGYGEAVFDGQFVYFVPNHNGTDFHGEVLRYNTLGDFQTLSSWATFDPGANGVGTDPDGYIGGVFDGRYIYFVPWHNGTEYHGEVLRYDTAGDFAEASSWAAYDPGANGVGTDPDGYHGAAFDGRYVYFSPSAQSDTERHGEVLRLDTDGDFSDPLSWTTYDPGANGVGNDPKGYVGAKYDGQYVYFVPIENSTEYHGEVLRYDTGGSFSDGSSWRTYDPGDKGVGSDPDGYGDAVFDGRFIYFAPHYNETEYHGEVLRFDSAHSLDCNENGVPDECDIVDLTSEDCTGNGIPDECEPDCNANATADSCDIDVGTSQDCNDNDLPDECEVPSGCGGLCTENCDPECDCNGVPDECDIATCDGEVDPACDDCNLNGVPDACDIALGTSLDDQPPPSGDGVPDECHEWDDEGGDDNWSTAENWENDTVPDNDGGDTYNVVIRGDTSGAGSVFLDMPATINSLRLLDAVTLFVIGDDGDDPAHDLSIVTEAGLLVQGDLDTTEPFAPVSSLQVGNARLIDVSAGLVKIGAAGEYKAAFSPVSATLTAETVKLTKGICTCPPACGALMQLTGGMTVTTSGDFIMNGSDVNICPDCGDRSARGGISPPPKLLMDCPTRGETPQIIIEGDFIVTGLVTLSMCAKGGRAAEPSIILQGNLLNESTAPQFFDATRAMIRFEGTSPQTFEVAGTNVGYTYEGYNNNFAFGTIEVATGSAVIFKDLVDNDGISQAVPEALYIDTLTLRSGSSLTIDRGAVYYRVLVDEGATIVGHLRALDYEIFPAAAEPGGPACVGPSDCTGAYDGADCIGDVCYVPKNRYLSIDPSTNLNPVAYQVELTEAPDYPTAGGRTWWVDEPVCYDYPNGEPVPGATTCEGVNRFGWVSHLTDTPVTRIWTETPLHLTGCGIAPVVTYEIRASADDGASFSDPLEIGTIHLPVIPQYWGDVTGGPEPGQPPWTGRWLPPDQSMTMADVQGAIRTFENRAEETGFPPRMWVDMEINQVVNLGDVQFLVMAFSGTLYADLEDLEFIGVHPADCP